MMLRNRAASEMLDDDEVGMWLDQATERYLLSIAGGCGQDACWRDGAGVAQPVSPPASRGSVRVIIDS